MSIEGTAIYCGDNCNHTGPHRYRPGLEPPKPGVNMFTVHCSHGLDLRVWPRCFLCRPLSEAESQLVLQSRVPAPTSTREETP